MTTSVETNSKKSMRVYVHSAHSEDPELIEVDGTILVSDFLVIAGGDLLWIEDVDEELDADLTLEIAEVIDLGHVHIGNCKKIDVSVRYGGETKKHKFAPSARIRRVTEWATGPEGFNLTAAEAEKHVLELPNSDHRVPDRTHVGSIADTASCSLVLDLQPKIRHEG